jgi:hypothetical protein
VLAREAEMSQGAIFMLIVLAAFPGVFIVAMVVKLREVRQAKRWPATAGTVVLSSVKPHQKRPNEPGYNFGDTEVTNEPHVEYEFQVGNRKYRGSRITIGDKTSSFELEAILARYPVGTAVRVYYDPTNPNQAVLERDLPAYIWYVAGGCLTVMIGGPLLAAFFYFQGLEWLKPHLSNPARAPFVAAATGFSLLVLLFALAYSRMIGQACRWPVTPGRIVASGVDTFLARREPGDRYRRKMHKSSILYTYEVNGREYLGDRIRLGVVTSANVAALPRRLAAKYPVGKEVTVYYDPRNPTEAVLQPHTYWQYFIWVIAAGMFVLAWSVGSGRLG